MLFYLILIEISGKLAENLVIIVLSWRSANINLYIIGFHIISLTVRSRISLYIICYRKTFLLFYAVHGCSKFIYSTLSRSFCQAACITGVGACSIRAMILMGRRLLDPPIYSPNSRRLTSLTKDDLFRVHNMALSSLMNWCL